MGSMNVANLIFCIVAIMFAVMGMIIRIGKGQFLMKGFVRNYDKKKTCFDVKKLEGFIAKTLYFCAGTFAVMTLGVVLEIKMVTWLGFAVFFAVVFYSAKYTENEENFHKK